jgi:hypothetical protein
MRSIYVLIFVWCAMVADGATGASEKWGMIASVTHEGETRHRVVECETTPKVAGGEVWVQRTYLFVEPDTKMTAAGKERHIWLWQVLPSRLDVTVRVQDGKFGEIRATFDMSRYDTNDVKHRTEWWQLQEGIDALETSILCILLGLGEIKVVANANATSSRSLFKLLSTSRLVVTVMREKGKQESVLILDKIGMDILKRLPHEIMASQKKCHRFRRKLSYADLPGIPSDGGLGGRRQRIWFVSDIDRNKTTSVVLVTDLMRGRATFGFETDNFDKGGYVVFAPLETTKESLHTLEHVKKWHGAL